MYVCMYVYMYVCMYTGMPMYVCMHMYVCMYVQEEKKHRLTALGGLDSPSAVRA